MESVPPIQVPEMAIEVKSSQRFASLGNLTRMACAFGTYSIHIPKDLEPSNHPRLFCVHHQLVFF